MRPLLVPRENIVFRGDPLKCGFTDLCLRDCIHYGLCALRHIEALENFPCFDNYEEVSKLLIDLHCYTFIPYVPNAPLFQGVQQTFW